MYNYISLHSYKLRWKEGGRAILEACTVSSGPIGGMLGTLETMPHEFNFEGTEQEILEAIKEFLSPPECATTINYVEIGRDDKGSFERLIVSILSHVPDLRMPPGHRASMRFIQIEDWDHFRL